MLPEHYEEVRERISRIADDYGPVEENPQEAAFRLLSAQGGQKRPDYSRCSSMPMDSPARNRLRWPNQVRDFEPSSTCRARSPYP